MAASALNRVKVDALAFPMLSGNLAAISASAAEWEPATEEADGVYAAPKADLSAAKGAILAIGLEGAAVLCLYGIWQLARFVR